MTKDLPERAYVVSPYTKSLCILYRGDSTFYGVSCNESADILNQNENVSRAQACAMLAGAEYGWDDYRANPDYYIRKGLIQNVSSAKTKN